MSETLAKAEIGDAAAQVELGDMYKQGKVVSPPIVTAAPPTKRLTDLSGRVFLVPAAEYDRLLRLKEQALTLQKEHKVDPAALARELAELNAEESKLDRAIKKDRKKASPGIGLWIDRFYAKKGAYMDRVRRASSPFDPESTQFYQELARLGSRER